jgi:prepilin-type N-terminal cleavage/methylation domain-containing protein
VRRRDQAGETLVEILIAIVIIGLVMGAIFATYATASTGSKGERDLVTADAVLRNYAEATQQAVRTTCKNAGAPFSVSYTPPTGYAVSAPANQLKCPAVISVQPVDITVTLPSTATRSLQIDVRTP